MQLYPNERHLSNCQALPVLISVISRIERGVVNTSVGNANLIAAALGAEVKELFDFIPL